MAKTKEQKKKVFEELKENIARQKTVIFIDFTGLKVKDMFDLRKNLKKADSQLKVAKKTLIQIAFKESGLKISPQKLKGEIALVFGYKDEISPAKAIYQFSKENPNLKILGGFFENKFREAEDFIALAQIPSKEELLARLAGSLSAPVTNFVRALEYNLKGLVYVLSKLKI
ncbi:MAG: 50S ribosomal protein L10 [Candidatus Nealsonbacteria bacterium]|nr:MAG: 50S ribosomal protein L10 [Candidatus Nealsonbacteria bacterium]